MKHLFLKSETLVLKGETVVGKFKTTKKRNHRLNVIFFWDLDGFGETIKTLSWIENIV